LSATHPGYYFRVTEEHLQYSILSLVAFFNKAAVIKAGGSL
jgi:hypothetical protein